MLDLFNVLENACETAIGANVPDTLLDIIHYVYIAIQIVVPIMLIMFGMIELAKAITAQKEDEIKKAQSGLLKKVVLAVLVFLVLSIVQFAFDFASADLKKSGEKGNVWNCVKCFIGGSSADACTAKNR